MDKTTYQKSVLATLDKKAVKVGLQQAAKQPQWSLLLQSLVGLAAETGALVGATQNYLSGGAQFTEEIKKAARAEMADIAYYLVAAAKHAKVALPPSTKKVKPLMTRTANVLHFQTTVASALAAMQQTFAVVPTKLVKKTITVPGADGATSAKIDKDVPVVDFPALKDLTAKAVTELQARISNLVGDYWLLHWSLFDEAPASTFALGRAQLAENFPAGFFAKIDEVKPKAEKAPAPAAPAAVAKPGLKKPPAKKAVKQLAEPEPTT